MKKITVDAHSINQRLDNFLMKKFKNTPKKLLYKLIRKGKFKVNKKKQSYYYKLNIGDEILITEKNFEYEDLNFEFKNKKIKTFPHIYEDNDILVVNKDGYTAVHGGSKNSLGVIEYIRLKYPDNYYELAHRIDKHTSGLLILAKNKKSLINIQKHFVSNSIKKEYIAISYNKTNNAIKEKFSVNHPILKKKKENDRYGKVSIQGKDSVSEIYLLNSYEKFVFLKIVPKTGRMHQIRIHLATEKLPIIGDDKYGDFAINRMYRTNKKSTTMYLHAYKLSFFHPITNKRLTLSAPIPKNFSLQFKHLII